MTERDEILSLTALKIGYITGRKKNVLLPPLSAVAKKGELIAVIGRNGIGKSTLLRTITGLQQPLEGSIHHAGMNIHDYSGIDLARRVGYISTEIVKVTNMRVYDLVALGRFPHTNWFGKTGSEDERIITEALEMTSMKGFSERLVSELSDGERQKAMIARIMAQDTGLLIMDEPTAFLDIGSKYEILHLMLQLTRKSNKTIIFSTHDLHMAIGQADKIWLILDDKLREGSPEDLMIEGAFDHLFESSSVQFSSETGTFSFREETKGALFIEGEGISGHWTEKAVIRAGYSISGTKTYPYIKADRENKKKWQLVWQESSVEFGSVYDLIVYLNSADIFTI